MPLPTTLSHSQVSTWRTCPTRWRLSYVDRVPEAPDGFLLLGRAVHAAIEADTLLRLNGEEAGAPVEEVLALGRRALADEAAKMDPDGTDSRLDLQMGSLRGRCDALLVAYCQQVRAQFHPLAAEQSFKFVIPDAPHPDTGAWLFTGRIDALVLDATGRRLIVDYKTANKPWRVGSEHQQDQATAYLLMAYMLEQVQAPVDGVVFIPLVSSFWAGSWMGRAEFRPTQRSREQLTSYLNLLHQVIGEMEDAQQSGDYPANVGPACTWCQVRARCPFVTHV